jgi:hypothetical protein
VTRGRPLVLGSLAALAVLVPLAAAVQPAYDLRDDLVSDLGARGASYPLLGHAIVLAVALAHVGAGLVLRTLRLPALVTEASLVALVAFPITCPRGARGCNGPDSGRASPKPIADVIHRDLVVVLEAASLVLGLLVLVHLVRLRSHAAVVVAAALVASPVCLVWQQQGEDIGYWQLSWLSALLTPLAALALCGRPRRRPHSRLDESPDRRFD